MGRWVFAEQRGSDARRGSNDDQLFQTEQTAEGEYAGIDALVREVLQNSLDAAAGSGCIRVRIALHDERDAPNRSRLAHYFSRLQTALAGQQVDFDSEGVPTLPCRFLVCEDFGTRGLEGDPLRVRDPEPGDPARQDFYWFWRNLGRSGKTGDDLGRFGLGKTVYRAASAASCMLGLTVRESDRQRFLMGQAVLQIHIHDGKEYVPEGFWCSGQNDDDVPLPISDDAELRRFVADWELARTDEPGLSVVAPYVPEELQADRLLQAVAVNFFTRIVRGELVVEVVGPDLGAITLDRDNIEAAVDRIKWDGPRPMKRHVAPPVSFARQCLESSACVESQLLGQGRVPTLDESAFTAEELIELRRKYLDGELICTRVRLLLPRLHGADVEGCMSVYLQRLDDGVRYDSYFVREGMTITRINTSNRLRSVRGLVIVDRGPLAELLGDTEGPAHQDWDKSQPRPKKTWGRGWKGRVDFVRGVLDRFVELLTPPITEPNFDLLSEFFSIQQATGSRPQKKPGKDSSEPSGFDGIKATPKWYRITARSGGFTISRDPGVALPAHPSLRVALAYDIPRGDPLRNWSRFDFDLGNGHLRGPTGRGVKAGLYRNQRNTLRLDITDEHFQFGLDGFDVNRDLFVKVDELSDDEEADT